MTTRRLAAALHQLHRSVARCDDAVADAQLLQRFVSRRDQAAFERLVWRHGPMVLGLCRRLLRHEQDAEDAFQATLLILARKAGSIGRGGSLGSWLYKVTYRVAVRARADARRRSRRELPIPEPSAVIDRHGPTDLAWRELAPVLDEELSRLPEKYRAPVVLCCLEGLTNEAAARQLCWPSGTVKTRLAHARRLLGTRLARRGFTLGAGLLAAEGFLPAGSAAVSAMLAIATARAAVLVVEGEAVLASVISAHVVSLTKGVLRAMTLMKLKVVAVTLAASLAVSGAGVVSYRTLAADPGDRFGPAPGQDRGAAGRVGQIKKRIAELQQELHQAEDAVTRDQESARQTPVAVIFADTPITRGELGDYLLRRLSSEQLQQYINLRIIEHAAQVKGIAVTDAEVEAVCAAERKAHGDNPESFDTALRRRHKTLTEWTEDVIRPRLLLAKLCRGRVCVTEQQLRDAFEANYGEKVECQMIRWPATEKAERLYPMVRANAALFALAARTQSTPSLAATEGRLPPFGRHALGNEELEEAAFSLKPGEISPLIQTPEGFAVIKCLRRIPPDTSRRFESERARLQKEVLDRLLQQEAVRFFTELKEQAKPRVLYTPEGAGLPAVP